MPYLLQSVIVGIGALVLAPLVLGFVCRALVPPRYQAYSVHPIKTPSAKPKAFS